MNRRRVLTMTLASLLCASAVAIRSVGAQTPRMVDGLVYANTPGHRVVAIGGVYVAFALPEGTTR